MNETPKATGEVLSMEGLTAIPGSARKAKAAKDVDGLSEAERKRLERAERTRRNRRGRKNPATVPAKLTRTSAFAPRRRGLIDRSIEKIFYVPGHSVVQVKGGELGSLHRDLLYALFRQKDRITTTRIPNPASPTGWRQDGVPTHLDIMEVDTTWRQIITSLNRTPHTNNLITYKNLFEDLKQVSVTIYEGNAEEIMQRLASNRLPPRGQITGLIDDVEWNGVALDSRVRVRFGRGIFAAVRNKQLVSLNVEVQFALRSDYAKSFWPYIDGQPEHTYIDESMLGKLVDRDVYGPEETLNTRAQFRKDCRQAFDDLVRAGGLKEWRVEEMGSGRRKVRRYLYKHALPRSVEQVQIELPLALAGPIAGTPVS